MSDYKDSNKGKSLLITKARILDGKGSLQQGLKSIRIDEGLITEIGDDLPAGDRRLLDAAGATVMPGLIDAHVHLQSVPGSAYRKDSEERLQKLRLHHLRSYLACGVTTVLDNGISATVLRAFQNHLDSGGVGPRIYALAPMLYPPEGYLDHGMLTPQWGPHWKPAGSKVDVQSLFAEYEGLERLIVGVKVLLEPGFLKWPIHSREMRQVIMEESAKRNLPIYIHALRKREQEIALDMGVYNFAHSGFIKGSPSEKFIGRMKAQGTHLTTTLASVFEQILIKHQPKRLDDPLVKLTVPSEELTTAADPSAWEYVYFTLARSFLPNWIPSIVLRIFTKLLNLLSGGKPIQRIVKNASKAIVKMNEAGIPIAIGTDTSNWPVFISFFHGPSTIREVELLGEAGMAPMDVLCSATRIPAEMMGKDHLIGTVEIGKRADLIVVGEDPLKNLTAFRRSLLYTIRDGDARTPKEWMEISGHESK